MTLGAVSIWLTQMAVTWAVMWDLRAGGRHLVSSALGVNKDHLVWLWLLGLTFTSLVVNSRVAAVEFLRHTRNRPSQDWRGFARSGASSACYWCGLLGFFASLSIALVLNLGGPALIRSMLVFLGALILSTAGMRLVLWIRLRARDGGLEEDERW